MELKLKRPLLFFDIESTGLNIPCDSIIELSFVKVFPNGEERIKTWRIKPWDYIAKKQRPIGAEASKVNGITDDMLIDCPTFYDLSDEIAKWVENSDFAGFNSAKFDLPMLSEEFERVKLAGKKINLNLHEPKMVDVQNIFHTLEPRNLKAAYRFYCERDLVDAHTAEADTLATYEILKAQLDRYDALVNDVDELAKYVTKKSVDFSGILVYDDKGEVIINIGKHKGKTARSIYETEPSYFGWVQNAQFTLDTKACFARLARQFQAEKSEALIHRSATPEELSKLADKFNGKLF